VDVLQAASDGVGGTQIDVPILEVVAALMALLEVALVPAMVPWLLVALLLAVVTMLRRQPWSSGLRAGGLGIEQGGAWPLSPPDWGCGRCGGGGGAAGPSGGSHQRRRRRVEWWQKQEGRREKEGEGRRTC
jgi:hypothetical protein